MSFRNVIADNGAKLRRNGGKSYQELTPIIATDISSSPIFKMRQNGGKIYAPTTTTVETTKTSLFRKGLKFSTPVIVWPTGNPDPYKNNVVLYLPCDGLNDGSYFQDFSPLAKTIGTSGSPVTKTAIKKYGQSSLYLNGSSHLFLANATDWQFGTGAFTIEFWSYGLSAAVGSYAAAIFAMPDIGAQTSGWGISLYPNATSQTAFNAATGGGTWNVFSGFSGSLSPILSNNSWAHCAFVRSGNNMLFFHNGILKNTVAFTSNTMPNPAQALNIGRSTTSNLFPLIGYLDSIRITKGVARYTANFDPENDTYLAY